MTNTGNTVGDSNDFKICTAEMIRINSYPFGNNYIFDKLSLEIEIICVIKRIRRAFIIPRRHTKLYIAPSFDIRDIYVLKF